MQVCLHLPVFASPDLYPLHTESLGTPYITDDIIPYHDALREKHISEDVKSATYINR